MHKRGLARPANDYMTDAQVGPPMGAANHRGPARTLRSRGARAVSLALASMMLASAVVGPLTSLASAYAFQQSVEWGGDTIQTFELTVDDAGPPGATFTVPLNASAQILGTSIEFEGRPLLDSVLLKGYGTANRNREFFGWEMEPGDFNGDGYGDVAIGAPAADIPTEPSRVDVFYGSPSGIGTRANWTWWGPAGMNHGSAMGHGDVNGDGYEDLLVGLENKFYRGTPPEKPALFYGSASGLSPTPDVEWQSSTPTAETSFGTPSTIEDLDGDGYADVLIGEVDYKVNGTSQGRVWIYPGGPGGPATTPAAWVAKPGDGYASFPYWFLQSLGDADGDGYGEFASSYYAWNGGQGGIVYMEGGPNITDTHITWIENGTVGPSIDSGIDGGRDVTGDGLPDLLTGDRDFQGKGAAYIFQGLANGSFETTPGIAVLGAATGDNFGRMVIDPDVNGDGRADVFATALRQPTTLDGGGWLFLNGNISMDKGGYIDGGTPGKAEGFGTRAQELGDLNGDGCEEFGVTYYTGYNGSYQPGNVRIFYGNPAPVPDNLQIAVGSTVVYTHAGALLGRDSASNFSNVLQAELVNHSGDADAQGIVHLPITATFENGGLLAITKVRVQYTVVLTPLSAAAVADPRGGAVSVTWAARSLPSLGSLVGVWSNKSGAWEVISLVPKDRLSYVDTNVEDGLTYYYRLTEFDQAANLHSVPSAVVSASPLDTQPPNVPSEVRATVDANARSILLEWSPNTDDTVSYEVFRQRGETGQSALLGTRAATQHALLDQALPEEVDFIYRVRAVDDAGLRSSFSAPVAARVPDITPPPTPTGLQSTALPNGTAVRLEWTPNAFDTVGYVVQSSTTAFVLGYEEYAQTTDPFFVASGLGRGGQYAFRVFAVDQVGNRSPPASISDSAFDAQAPSPPTLTRVEPRPEGNAVVVEWDTTEDDVYTFYIQWTLDGVWQPDAEVDSTHHSYNITGVPDGIAMLVHVAADDFTGHRGNYSTNANVVPRDTVAPAAPSFAVAQPASGGSAIEVSWGDSPDADVEGYKIYLIDADGTQPPTLVGAVGAAGVGQTSFTVEGLENGVQYAFAVSALDEVANEGPLSEVAKATTGDSLPPATPRLQPLPAVTNIAVLVVGGWTEPGLQVEVTLGGTFQGQASADATGAFSYSLNLQEGANEVAVRAYDARPDVDSGARFSAYTDPVTVLLDTIAPSVKSTDPGDGASGVAPQRRITVTFSEPIDPTTLRVSLLSPGGGEVAVDQEYEPLNRTLSLTAVADLLPLTTYTLRVEVADNAGNEAEPATVSFTTVTPGDDSVPYYMASGLMIVGAAGTYALIGMRRRRGGG